MNASVPGTEPKGVQLGYVGKEGLVDLVITKL